MKANDTNNENQNERQRKGAVAVRILYHDEILGDHSKITISGYRKQAKRLQVRTCTQHDCPYIMGCTTCCTVACIQCASVMGTCVDEKHHELISLDDSVGGLMKEINELKAELIDKEDRLDGLFKKTSEIIADFDAETEDMVKRIRHRRDEQIEAINEKYENLEKELIELRANCKSAMETFMEKDVGVKLSDLNKHRMKMEARIKHSHQVDIVNGYKDTKEDMQKLLEDEMPMLELDAIAKVDSKDESREIELFIDSAGYGYIDWENGLITSKPIRKAFKLLQTVQLNSCCRSVSHCRGNTYVGLDDYTVSKIDADYQLMNSFLTLAHRADGVGVYKGKLYKLVYGTPYTVNVHTLSGQLTASWSHTDSAHGYLTKMAILANQVVIPDRANQRLTVYSLTGQILKHVPCSQLSNNNIAICAANQNSVIISNCNNHQVFRMNIRTGKVMWTSTEVSYPHSVVCYGQSCVLVAKKNCSAL